ncbi:hypothetical protein HG530_000592 [Fusarium avenaceum]|nr:hypothetical protein HG530_000592 [Fusarium avenaceum]
MACSVYLIFLKNLPSLQIVFLEEFLLATHGRILIILTIPGLLLFPLRLGRSFILLHLCLVLGKLIIIRVDISSQLLFTPWKLHELQLPSKLPCQLLHSLRHLYVTTILLALARCNDLEEALAICIGVGEVTARGRELGGWFAFLVGTRKDIAGAYNDTANVDRFLDDIFGFGIFRFNFWILLFQWLLRFVVI